ncbi:hypothetical protein [Vibrio harveyi]
MKLVIDLFSKNWVHKDFNIQFINEYTEKNDVIMGNKGAHFFEEIENREKIVIEKNINIIHFFRLLKGYEEITFLVLLNRYFFLVAISLLMRKKTYYVVHKYNLSTRKRRKWVNLIYLAYEKLGLKSLSFEEADSCFSNNNVLDLNMWKNTPKEKVKKAKKITKVAFVGKPVPGKNFELLKKMSKEHNFQINVYCDQKFEDDDCTVLPFVEKIEGCDAIWGYYDPDFYKGIQSGLCYPTLISGLQVITNNRLGFVYFSQIYGDYVLNCENLCRLNEIFKED